ncbi:hypothetical protein [Clostridium tagluense]|uniref:hypothetical protein n=1 Tax=Clostridium tagluense TaxID=360422 RepID=UPI001CF222C0|nr:hypothetical protein [Clostridium tagluense]MCB2297762.1 hypothetical protein [Clostridium tagluense]
MTLGRTRCKQCVHADKKVTQEPCNKCNEIQPKFKFKENQFLDASKNLMKED